ncbi:unnamed protein product [Ambrosiozyma monospora]|uniref:Protein-serine/threonine kinase n=1 Tax=Ambrosiozyma monospora TaxID=43982 RepID=A0A9W6YX98_AMBMO|nr:unnamed protein product [Ambrosiozyma monospora]
MSSLLKQQATQQSVKLSEIIASINGLSPYHNYSKLLNEQHFYQNSIMLQWSERTVHPVTLRQLANFGKRLTKEKLISGANFVRTEIPTRLALKIKELQRLDFEISNNFHLRQVYESYYHCFNAFRRTGSIDTLDENENFCNFLSNVLDDHLLILPHLMMGSLEVSILQLLPQHRLDEFISSMIRSRISRRLIMEQHISLSRSFLEQEKNGGAVVLDKSPDFVGLVRNIQGFSYQS